MLSLLLGDCRRKLRRFRDNTFTACVTDPPYEMNFMGRGWDRAGVSFDPETWVKVYRVLKPGAFLFAFGGTRTFHRIAVAIEDAGFLIRDCIMWVHGQGFPKSLNISKAIPATDAAKLWEGYGTTLKPAWEPIIVAMKPLDGNFAQNAIRHGVAGLWIDGARIASDKQYLEGHSNSVKKVQGHDYGWSQCNRDIGRPSNQKGRYPTNLIHDGSEEVIGLFPATGKSTGGRIGKKSVSSVNVVPVGQYRAGDPGYGDSGSAARFFYCAKATRNERERGLCGQVPCAKCGGLDTKTCYGDPRNAKCIRNNHPTVKPLALMRYLVTLVTYPQSNLILDPFCGSGTTLLACQALGLSCVGIDNSPDFLSVSRARLWAQREVA